MTADPGIKGEKGIVGFPGPRVSQPPPPFSPPPASPCPSPPPRLPPPPPSSTSTPSPSPDLFLYFRDHMEAMGFLEKKGSR